MSRAEKFIQDYTRNCSNEYWDVGGNNYCPWLTPDQALRAVEIAREELIGKAVKWLDTLSNYNAYFYPSNSSTLENFVNNFKLAMKDE